MNAILDRALQRLAKWRTVFASWQLGTRSDTDGECKAVKDHREATIFLRAELSAVTKLCMEAGIFTPSQLDAQLLDEANYLNEKYKQFFPGFETTEIGVSIDPVVAVVTTRRMGFPD